VNPEPARTTGTETIQIRPLTTLEEFNHCVELQREVWDFTDLELVPKEIFVVAAGIGGQVFGAFDGAEQIGFLVSVPGIRGGRSYLHSHMTAVLADYRDKGVGRRLKLQQREDALARGIELVEWTFDPLELKNAYFNIVRLGAMVRKFVRNKYGHTTSPLHGNLPTDRLVAEWWLKSVRVETILRGQPPAPGADRQRVAVPRAIGDLKKSDAAAAEKIQAEARQQFEHWLGQGYAVTGFELTDQAGTYLLEPDAD
jgi:predicted GNAT superfamily acetyltransferase